MRYISISLVFPCECLGEVPTLLYFPCLALVASSTEPASAISSSVTGGTGHFWQNSSITVGKKSLAAVFFWFTSRNAGFSCSNHVSCSSDVHFQRVISESALLFKRNEVRVMWLGCGYNLCKNLDCSLFVEPHFCLFHKLKFSLHFFI